MDMKKYRLASQPITRSESTITGDCYRITILTPSLIRLEYSPEGYFEDRPTQSVLNRDFPAAAYYLEEKNGELILSTEYLELHYDKKPFSPGGLYIRVRCGKGSVWHYGDAVTDLGGTARTLDGADGAIPLEHGLMSRKGYSVVDDSHSMALTEDGWVEPRKQGIDLYFFGYCHRYLECLKDFYHLCGKTPLLPRYVFGNWWSRYHRYTDEEYRRLMERFEREKLPFSVAVIDMDWHLVDDVDPKYGSGWTGFTWNRNFFPDPEAFLDWLHEHGMKVTLNLHPADGIRAYEEAYPEVAKALGIDPESGEAVPFLADDPRFMSVYLEVLLHRLEKQGVDFWWIDWQQGSRTRTPGLDPLWMLNHYHYLDSAWKGTRPLTFSRYAGVGSHRYPIGFSGDTVISWESLDFQPYFTNTASNIGYGWWSHDIGGHMRGVRDDELTARWGQYGVFSPINRLHSTDNPFNGKEPWKYNAITREVLSRYLRLRHGLVPYLYTMNRRANREDLPLVQPMYYLEPEQEEAYQVSNEYYFGSELLVSPITVPQDREAQAAKVKTWLPEGLWADFFTGLVYRGGRMVNMWRGIEDIPVLMKAGAIVPMKDMREFDNSIENPSAMELRIFPAADGSFTLWEDQGDTPVDRDENWVSTQFTLKSGKQGSFIIGAAQGNRQAIPQCRSWKLVFVGTAAAMPQVLVDGRHQEAAVSTDEETGSLIVEVAPIPVGSEIAVVFPDGLYAAENRLNERCYRILEKAQIGYNLKAEAMKAIEKQGQEAIASLMSMNLGEGVLGALCEVLTAR